MQVPTGPSTSSSSTDRQSCQICAHWDPTEPPFEPLNAETPRDSKLYITIAVDLVIRGIREPVRFLLETPVKVFSQNERFWYFSRRSLVQQFFLNLKEVSVLLINNRSKLNLFMNRTSGCHR